MSGTSVVFTTQTSVYSLNSLLLFEKVNVCEDVQSGLQLLPIPAVFASYNFLALYAMQK